MLAKEAEWGILRVMRNARVLLDLLKRRAVGGLGLLRRTAARMASDHLPLLAAGVAFFLLLGLFPGLAALIAIYGWLADPVMLAGQLGELFALIPVQAAEVILRQAGDLAHADAGLGWGAFFGMLVALWASSRAMKGVVDGLNIAHARKEMRGFVHRRLIYLTLTVAVVLAGLVSLLLIALIPVVVNFLPISSGLRGGLLWLRWPVLLGIGMTVLAAIYSYGPARPQPQWRWGSWGACVATLLWLLASGLFSLYVSNFGNFNKTYGSLGAAVVLLLWLYLTAFLLLTGAEIDAEIEATRKSGDTEV